MSLGALQHLGNEATFKENINTNLSFSNHFTRLD